ncbi:DCTN2 protein, partial [Urocolius indicus]|nr:DCTN2 protein [Urocolius indicus]
LGEGPGARETPQQRYQRLQHEVQELVREVEQIQVSLDRERGARDEDRGAKGERRWERGEGLVPTLVCPPSCPRRLLQQLEVAKCGRAAPGKGSAGAAAPAADAVTFELFWRPEREQFAHTAKVAELEKRLAQLEATLQCEPDSQ